MQLSRSLALLTLAVGAAAQCPYYATGTVSAGLSRVGGGEDLRLVYVDCLSSIGVVNAKFGNNSNTPNLNGMPLTIAVFDDPNDDSNPRDAVLVAQTVIAGGVTGGNTGQWQQYDLRVLLGAVVPTTGGMFVGVGVQYPALTTPGPGSIEFFNNIAPGTQWLCTDSGNTGINYSNIGSHALVDIQTGPGFPPGSWVIQVESGADYRPFGTGCMGSNGTPTLAGGPVTPSPGLAIVYAASNLPSPGMADFLLIGFGLANPTVDLGSALGGAPNGCVVRVNPLVTALLGNVAGTATHAIGIPVSPNFVGISVLGQAVSFDPPANAAGVTVSNGLRAVIGW